MRRALDDRAAGLLAVVCPTVTVPDDPALVLPLDTVVDGRPAVATVPAPPELGVELLEHLSCDLRQGHITERRLDVPPPVPVVAAQRALLGLVHAEPGVERGGERGLRPGVAALVDLAEQTGEDLSRLGLAGRGLGEVVSLAGQRVDTGVDQDLERVSPLADVATLAPAPGGSLRRHARRLAIDTPIARDGRPRRVSGRTAWSEGLPRVDSNH